MNTATNEPKGGRPQIGFADSPTVQKRRYECVIATANLCGFHAHAVGGIVVSDEMAKRLRQTGGEQGTGRQDLSLQRASALAKSTSTTNH